MICPICNAGKLEFTIGKMEIPYTTETDAAIIAITCKPDSHSKEPACKFEFGSKVFALLESMYWKNIEHIERIKYITQEYHLSMRDENIEFMEEMKNRAEELNAEILIMQAESGS